MKTIGLTLKTLRESKKLTLRQLAENAQVQYSQLSNIENGKQLPSLETIDRLSHALGITVSNLIFISEQYFAISEKGKQAFAAINPYFSRIEEVIDRMNNENGGNNDNNDSNEEREDNRPIIRGGGMKKAFSDDFK